MSEPRPIVLTDPPDLPREPEPCPRCGAGPEKRKDASGFGRKKLTICGECMYEFPGESCRTARA